MKGGGTLNPAWVELLMGWPMNFTCLNPISDLEYNKWLMGFTDVEEMGRDTEALRKLRGDDDPQEVQGEAGGPGSFREAQVLQSFVRQHKDRYLKVGLALAGKEVSEKELRGVWNSGAASSPPRGRQPQEHEPEEPEEPADALYLVPSVYPSYGRQAWVEGAWEATVPRVATGVPNRVARLKAIGNGQVPAAAALAWTLLGGPIT